MLFGRDRELTALGGLIDAARDGHGGALVFSGPPGIGKTALLRAAGERADGFRILRTTGIESEAGLPFTALHMLLAPVLDRIPRLPGPQADALRGAFGLARPPTDDTRFLVGLGLLTLLGELAEKTPVLCLVDDTQWLDGPSSASLAFAARRLTAERVAVVFAARDEEEGAATGLPGIRVLTPGALDAAEARAVVEAHSPALGPGARDRVVAESAGNPLALRELAAGLGETAVTDVAPTALRASAAVTATFRRRLAELPDTASRLLVVAAADRSCDVGTLMSAARSLGCDLADLDTAVRARVLVVEGSSYAFRHPLIRSTAYQDASVTDRVNAHRALGDALSTSSESTGGADVLAATWHRALAATGPDADVSAAMEQAADNAWVRGGGPAEAYALAARLHPEQAHRARLLTRAAQTAIVAGDTGRATELSASAAGLTDDPALRAALAMIDGTAENFRGHPRRAANLLVTGAEGLVSADTGAPGFTAAPETGLAATLLAIAAGYAWFSGDETALGRAAALAGRCVPGSRVGAAIRGLAALSRVGAQGRLGTSSDGRFPTAPGTAYTPATACTPGNATTPGSAAAMSSLTEFIAHERTTPASSLIIRMFAAHCARIIGDDEAAADLGEAESTRCRAYGTVSALPDVLAGLAHARLGQGRHREAEATVAEAAAFAADVGQTHVLADLHAVALRVAAIAGDAERCRAITDAHPELTGSPALGLLELGLGNHEEALAHLEAVVDGLESPGAAPAVFAIPDLVEAAVRAGRSERAAKPLERFLAWADAAPVPWLKAVAARCRALPDFDRKGADETVLEYLFVSALDHHAVAGRPFEFARTELLYGEWLRRARRRVDARGQLRSAEARFTRLGAVPWAARARAELRAAGEGDSHEARIPASALDSLTTQELHVVRLAATGAGNQEIATRLFLSRRTVEYHLYKAYPKLGVSSRRELVKLDLPELR
ncbi:MAG TPA: AAA family ATPase [Yinghuangia sp.]|nr:AAA family ATPase [Yinghuangia sp.]